MPPFFLPERAQKMSKPEHIKNCTNCPISEVCIQSVTALPCPIEGAKDESIKINYDNTEKE